MKLHLGKRARSHVQGQETWWAQNRQAAPDLFAREFKETLEHIRTAPGAGVRWPTATRPTLRRILMRRALNHIYFRVDADKGVVHVLQCDVPLTTVVAAAGPFATGVTGGDPRT